MGLDLTQTHLKMEKKTKKRIKKVKKIVVGAGFEPTTLRLQNLHLTLWAKIATPVKFNGFFSKVNQVIYSSSPIS